MSQKKAKKERKDREEAEANRPSPMSELTAPEVMQYADGVKKPFLVRFYNWMLPNEYTRRQDFHHVLALFSILVATVALVVVAVWLTVTADERNKQEELVIPKTSFVDSQRQSVVDLLVSYGFRVPDAGGKDDDVRAYGTKSMVEQYQQSYYDKNVNRALEEVEDDYDELMLEGVPLVKVENDGRELQIHTLVKFTGNSQLSDVLYGTTLGTLVDTLANWCQMKYGEKLRISLVDAQDTQEEYRAFENVPSASALIAMLEKQSYDVSDGQGGESEEAL